MTRRLGILVAMVCLFLAAPGLARADGGQTFYVNSTADTDSSAADCLTVTVATAAGPGSTCTLRGALEEVNSAESADPGVVNTIEFSVCGPFEVTSALPTVPQDTVIDGSDALNDPTNTANNYCPETVTDWIPDPGGGYASYSAGNYGFAHIQGPGDAAFDGLVLAGSGSVVSGVIIGGFRNGVVMDAPGGDTLYDSGIGNDPYEGGPLNPESSGNGVDVTSGSAGDVVGYAPAQGQSANQDDIYGNQGWGVYLAAGSGPTIVGHNFIGTDSSGDLDACDAPVAAGYSCPSWYSSTSDPIGTPIPDGNGLGGVYDDGSGDTIGGTVSCSTAYVCTGNVIGANLGPGVRLGPEASHDVVDSNQIGESLNYYDGVPPEDRGALPNQGAGIDDQGSGDTIGGSTAGAGNLVSGNAGPGILLEGDSALVENNLVGLDAAGTAATPNAGAGVPASDDLDGASGANRIIANTIGGNSGPGIELDQPGDTINANDIGLAGDQSSPLPNSVGILVQRGPETIGGATSVPNQIAYNRGAGIEVLDPASGGDTTGVGINDNSIHDNGGLGIDLGGDGVTANHIPDTVPGPNGWTNYPVVTAASAAGGQWVVHGTLTGPPSAYTSIYLYGSPSCDPSGYGQGATFLGGGAATTNASGTVNFTITGKGTLPASLSSYADGPNGTSEFGPCAAPSGGADLTATQSVTGGAAVISGDPTDIDINVANSGPADATNVTIDLTVPTGEAIAAPPAGCPSANGSTLICDIGSVAAGASSDVHVILTPSAGVQNLTDSVSVSSDQVQLGTTPSTLSTPVTVNPSQPVTITNPVSNAAPAYGTYLRLTRNSGSISAQLPNGQTINVANYAIIPVGTIVTATNGQAGVAARLPDGRLTRAAFRYGRFQVTQPKAGSGAVDVALDEPLTGCTARQLSTGSAHRAFSALPGLLSWPLKRKTKKTKTRRLWGHDAGGTYTITGNRGAATVQGTTWEVIDTCTTTTVIVYQDSVKVVGFGNTVPKSAIVTAGHRVVLRAR